MKGKDYKTEPCETTQLTVETFYQKTLKEQKCNTMISRTKGMNTKLTSSRVSIIISVEWGSNLQENSNFLKKNARKQKYILWYSIPWCKLKILLSLISQLYTLHQNVPSLSNCRFH